MTDQRRTSVWQLIGVGVAALVTATVGVLALTAGEPPAEAGSGGSGGGGGNGSGGGSTSTTIEFGFPFCRTTVTDTGDGYHVAVTLENDLPMVWVVVESGDEEVTVEVPLTLGMGQAALPVDAEPDKVVVWGTPDQQQYSAGCYWAPT